MGYVLGIDLGTTYTAVATYRDGRAQIVSIGTRAAAIPSVVFLRQDSAVLTGEAADRRALSEPGRVAREFKRRMGDTTPIMVGGSPYSAEQLSAEHLNDTYHIAELTSSWVTRIFRPTTAPGSFAFCRYSSSITPILCASR